MASTGFFIGLGTDDAKIEVKSVSRNAVYEVAVVWPAKLVGNLLGEASNLVVVAGAIGLAYLAVRILSWRISYAGALNKFIYWIVGAFFFMYGGLLTNEALRYMAAAIFRATEIQD